MATFKMSGFGYQSKIAILVFFNAICLFSGRADAVDLTQASKAVVKLYVTHQSWNMKQPWTKGGIQMSTCSAFYITEGILTNAHCITDATYMQMEVSGHADKIDVEVAAVNHQVDLAIVKPKDSNFKPDIRPIELGGLPNVREKVVTIGYPAGGRQVSYTEGVVSRIDIMNYAHSNIASLMVQTDAAINPGNSGGPVFSDKSGTCLGVATQKLRGGEAIGYFVPIPVVKQFLQDLVDGHVDGIPALGITIQTLENPAIRQSLDLNDEQTGVRVVKISSAGSTFGKLAVDDVLLEIDGHQIFNDGRVLFRDNMKIDLRYYVTTRQLGDDLELRISRKGRVQPLVVHLTPYPIYLIPRMPQYDQKPRYYEIGGIIFQAVEPRYLMGWGRHWPTKIPSDIRSYYSEFLGEHDYKELVIVSGIYRASANKGYSGFVENSRVVSINGIPIKQLADVSKAFASATGNFHQIELENGARIVLDKAKVDEEEAAIRQRYNIN